MIIIYFDNGDCLAGKFTAHDKMDMESRYSVATSKTLCSHIHDMVNIKITNNGVKDIEDGFWYPVNKIIKFRDLSDDEIKQLERDGKLNELGI